MNLSRNAAAIAVLSGLAIIGVIVLIATGHPVPDFLSLIAVSGLGALAGVSLPDSPADGISTELTTLVGGVAGKLDTLIGHVLGHGDETASVAATSRDTIDGGPLPAAEPVTDAGAGS